MHWQPHLDEWLQVIRSEFTEVPDLELTLDEATSLWDLDHDRLKVILDTFVDVGFLMESPDGVYSRRPYVA